MQIKGLVSQFNKFLTHPILHPSMSGQQKKLSKTKPDKFTSSNVNINSSRRSLEKYSAKREKFREQRFNRFKAVPELHKFMKDIQSDT